MTLPIVINPGDPGHISHHEEAHGLLDDVNQVGGFLLPQWKQGTLAARPAAGNAGAIYWATDIPLLFFDTGASWNAIGNRIRTDDRESTADFTLTTTPTDITGASLTITTVLANAFWFAWASFDFNWATASNDAVGELLLNNVAQTGQDIYGPSSAGRAVVGQSWRGPAAIAGAFTFKLRASKSGAGGVVSALSVHTTLRVMMIEGNVSG